MENLENSMSWSIRNGKWQKQIVYEGDGLCIFPGDPYLMEVQMERFLKQLAYTSEKGIDWWCEQVAERVGDRIFRGIILKMDDWLYNKLIKYS
jgi:hypothetical protein